MENLFLQLNDNAIVGECMVISENSSRCIIMMDEPGEVVNSNIPFKISEISAASSNGYIDVNLVELPTEISIGNAYPNPFNPVVNIDFSLQFQSEVKVGVYDIIGKEVAILTDGIMDEGQHFVMWNADEFSSGIYFVKFQTNNFLSTQKIMLIK